ncbi:MULTISPECIES: XrtA/PEP-CTERM system exopolysaccharide export protein [Halorhodospira]|uniref:XrtA/PEP-CTERM system exopolysaccharide export protein n=1 Tax=Halorhodospira TaxID=85108 RepID=UPI001914C68F|nr:MULTISPECIES: XrtA/PEP-CTERM system exopolysaccharide export protein [Halorhodospira]MBK5936127.1 sugar ABC transporter substrate-binding protein [Halorhodospira halophila]MCG5537267.1 polysaccharide export protein [Halorhodospira sp. 9622]MCG5540169.1 polysaccharide export protein [Halorhodospira sp. M39old]MCG5545130.1 polysaccharide export protein [Halorhodospira sp. M38]
MGSRFRARPTLWLAVLLLGASLTACGGPGKAPPVVADRTLDQYIIGPGDTLTISVWRNPELSMSVPVRPDGQISTPLVEDLQASGVTPTQLARAMEDELANYLRDPVVTVIVTGFAGPYERQIRVIGQAAQPQALQYRENMTVMDVLIAVGGMTDFAAGNRAVIVRQENGRRTEYRVRLDDLLNAGDIRANVDMVPGDILIIPERFF